MRHCGVVRRRQRVCSDWKGVSHQPSMSCCIQNGSEPLLEWAFMRRGTLWRTFEIDVQFSIGHEATERPRVDEPAVIAVAEVVEDDAASRTDARGHLEQIHQLLRC